MNLYELLPAIIRARDEEQGFPLRALLSILQEQHDVLERDVAALHDDWFIETCGEWVVPYIGDLISAGLAGAGRSQRAVVANTLHYRRRKGTLLMLEDLARDVTGWGAHAVAGFETLGWTQHLDHLRRVATPDPEGRHPWSFDRVGKVNLRHLDVVDRIDSAFDIGAHNVDIRPGRVHDLRRLGLYLWRLDSYPLRGVTPRRSADYADGFHFSTLGAPAPLFVNPERAADDTGFATETTVPGAIRRVAFHAEPQRYYGDGPEHSVALFVAGVLVDATTVMCKDLAEWSPPPAGVIAIDVALGRIAFAPGESPADGLTANWHQGFSADIGGGPYDRRDTLERAAFDDFVCIVAQEAPDPLPPVWQPTVAQALAAWDPVAARRAVITIVDNGTYEENLTLALADDQRLVIQAGDRNRPTLRLVDGGGALGTLAVAGGAGAAATLVLGGLLIEGAVTVTAGSLGRLELRHATLVPGRALDEAGWPLLPDLPSLEVEADNPDLEVVIESCLTGPVRMDAETAGLEVRDAVVDSPRARVEVPGARRVALAADDAGLEPGPATVAERVTFLGEVHVRELTLASDVIFTHAVTALRRQAGCVRFSFVDDELALTPRRYRCQPDLSLARRREELGVDELDPLEAALLRSRLRPHFTSERYGEPAYAQLRADAAMEIRGGASSQAEMGAFEQLRQILREADLRARWQEYLIHGLEPVIVFVT